MKRCGRAIHPCRSSRLGSNQALQELTTRVDALAAEVRLLADTTEVLSEIIKTRLINDLLTDAKETAERKDADVTYRVECCPRCGAALSSGELDCCPRCDVVLSSYALKSLVGLPLTAIKSGPIKKERLSGGRILSMVQALPGDFYAKLAANLALNSGKALGFYANRIAKLAAEELAAKQTAHWFEFGVQSPAVNTAREEIEVSEYALLVYNKWHVFCQDEAVLDAESYERTRDPDPGTAQLKFLQEVRDAKLYVESFSVTKRGGFVLNMTGQHRLEIIAQNSTNTEGAWKLYLPLPQHQEVVFGSAGLTSQQIIRDPRLDAKRR